MVFDDLVVFGFGWRVDLINCVVFVVVEGESVDYFDLSVGVDDDIVGTKYTYFLIRIYRLPLNDGLNDILHQFPNL